MKKNWAWILIVGLLLCVIAGLVVALIVLHGGSIPLAPFGPPAEAPAAIPAPSESAAPGAAPQGTEGGDGAEAATPAGGGEDGSEGPAPGVTAGGTDAALPEYGGAYPPPYGENGDGDFELPEGLSGALGIVTDTGSGLADGSIDIYSALENMGDAVSSVGEDSPMDVSGATDALEDTIAGVTDRNNG